MGEGNRDRQTGSNQPLEEASSSRNGKIIVEPVRDNTLHCDTLNNIKEIEGILSAFEFMKTEGLSEIEFSLDGTKVLIKRKIETPSFLIEPIKREQKKDEFREVEREPCKKDESIKSPLPGIFYASSKPNFPAFVNVGDTVDEGATLCIIEAMKTMNEIKADKKYKILKVLIANGKPVAADAVLFFVKAL
ncbi:MAG: biotin/lipoyl-containing protein [Elusimicrobiota bacterium]